MKHKKRQDSNREAFQKYLFGPLATFDVVKKNSYQQHKKNNKKYVFLQHK